MFCFISSAHHVSLLYPCSDVRPVSVRRRPYGVHNFNHLLRNRLTNQNLILCGTSMVSGRKFVHGIWVTLPRWPPNPYMVKRKLRKIFSGTSGPIATKLDMQHLGLGPIIVFFSNDDTRLTLTYFAARSNCVT